MSQGPRKFTSPAWGLLCAPPPPKSKITGIWKGGAQRTHEMRISGWGNRAEGWGLLEGEPLDGRAQCLCPTGRGWGWAQCGGRSAPAAHSAGVWEAENPGALNPRSSQWEGPVRSLRNSVTPGQPAPSKGRKEPGWKGFCSTFFRNIYQDEQRVQVREERAIRVDILMSPGDTVPLD